MTTLSWVSNNQPVDKFSKNGPTLTYIKKLVKAGLIESDKELIPHPKFNGGIATYSLSKLGKSVLKGK